jgi:hypothetical protein
MIRHCGRRSPAAALPDSLSVMKHRLDGYVSKEDASFGFYTPKERGKTEGPVGRVYAEEGREITDSCYGGQFLTVLIDRA